jgi:O-6-methylguanine DNA methyltransferase
MLEIMQDQSLTMSIPTPDGVFVAHYSDKGLSRLEFPSGQNDSVAGSDPNLPPRQVRAWHAATVKALKRVLSGKAPKTLPPLDLSSGTDFQQRVWQALLNISCGQTLSYGQVAAAIGNPKALRAVGGACGANPIPVLVPCHRVLAANHRLGGFGGGLDWKRDLLTRERVQWNG